MSLHPGTDRYNPAGNSEFAGADLRFTRKAESLALGISNWSTPKATDGAKGGPGRSYGSGGMPPLPAQAAQWPTPAAQNWKGSSPDSITRADGKSRMDILHYRAEQGFTHPAPAIVMHGRQSSHHAPISRPLWASMIASHGPVVSRRILKGRSRRRLNPLFVGWLMGWPIGHARGTLGNGVHPLAAAHAWCTLAAAHGLRPLDLATGRWAGKPSADGSF
jgi:hypothetical protein